MLRCGFLAVLVWATIIGQAARGGSRRRMMLIRGHIVDGTGNRGLPAMSACGGDRMWPLGAWRRLGERSTRKDWS
jgi:hypothetical protein